MRRARFLVLPATLAATTGALVAAIPARAQPTDAQLAQRCADLGALWDQYGARRSEGSGGPNMTRVGAGIDCQKGRYAQGIKALEDLLRRNQIKVPPA